VFDSNREKIFSNQDIKYDNYIYIYENDQNWFNSEYVQHLLDKKTHSIARNGNKLTLLINGIESRNKRRDNVNDAEVILIKTFEFLMMKRAMN